jgi:hypothetical protein
MKLEEPRSGLFRATLTAHELSVLLAGARMSLSLMESGETTSGQARASLERVLSDFDAELARIRA